MNFSALDYTVFFVIILIVIIVSFLGARWRKADLKQISEWSVGGRRFGTIIVWFLMEGIFILLIL
ncbi:MAG: hypothetical protein M1477_05005 [Candidatus Thermoplasmatota archaeon]|nr:hypothetical protein [Candidatus Thermoplasmatota archaeon]